MHLNKSCIAHIFKEIKTSKQTFSILNFLLNSKYYIKFLVCSFVTLLSFSLYVLYIKRKKKRNEVEHNSFNIYDFLFFIKNNKRDG